jgi:threonine/homoserine/homoserine lactone efflux protein
MTSVSMELFNVLLAALVIGVSIAAPVGPIGMLTIQRSLDHGRRAGLATGLGAACADAVYAALGAFGVSWLVQALVAVRLPLVLLGSSFLLWMAWGVLRTPLGTTDQYRQDATVQQRNHWQDFASTFLLTLSNPSTIFSFIALFGAMASHTVNRSFAAPLVMVFGVWLGSALWWLFLSSAVGMLRERFTAHWRRAINWLSAMVLICFALLQLSQLLPGSHSA